MAEILFIPRKPATQDLTGKVFGRLTVTEFFGYSVPPSYPRGIPMWRCRCECGKEPTAYAGNLVRGLTKSCGCFSAEQAANRKRTHGMTYHPVYGVWERMWDRCTNPKTEQWHNYGGRGIKVCERWGKFENFYADMGASWKKGLSIDRIAVNGNYESSNCRWATSKEQGNNTRVNHRITLDGKTQTMSQWADEMGVKPRLIAVRLARGWNEEEAVRTPAMRHGEVRATKLPRCTTSGQGELF